MNPVNLIAQKNETLPKKSWLEPVPWEVRRTRDDGTPYGRWLRVYKDKDGSFVALVTKPTRNTRIPVPASLLA